MSDSPIPPSPAPTPWTYSIQGNGRFLATFNGDVSPSGSGITSLTMSPGSTGLTFTPGSLSAAGTITMSGTLDVAHGGTGAATVTPNALLYGNGTDALQEIEPVIVGRVLASTGTGSPPAWIVPARFLGFDFLGAVPTASQILGGVTLPVDGTIPANCLGSVGSLSAVDGIAPTADYEISIQIDGSEVGTVTISTSGGYTFTTTGGLAIGFSGGQVLELVGNATPDSTLENFYTTIAVELPSAA